MVIGLQRIHKTDSRDQKARDNGIEPGWYYILDGSDSCFDPQKPKPNDNAVGPFRSEQEALKHARQIRFENVMEGLLLDTTLTQRQIAERIGISQTGLSLVINQKRNPSELLVRALEMLLHIQKEKEEEK